jgi:dTDP-4-dehydrorhamnose 3,5-epimerase
MTTKTYDNWILEKTSLDGVVKITPSVFKDFRGEYIETYNKDFMIENKIDINFLQDDISVSKKNVLRGIHGNDDTWKLISCLYGNFQLIVVNNDKNSNQFKKWESFDLSLENRLQILVPPKFGNGHVVLSEKAIFHYKQNTQYDRKSQFTIKWNDPEFGFKWKIDNPILSGRDK